MFLRKQRRTETGKQILRAIDADKRRRDREQSRWTWRNKRNVGFSLFISICVFGATASTVSALLKHPFFDEFLDRDGYWSANGLGALIGGIACLCTILFLADLWSPPLILQRKPRKIETPAPTSKLEPDVHATGQLVTPALREKEAMQADAKLSRPATVSAMTTARGWMTFAGFIISCLLLASVVVIFAKYWT